jgi:hypothetical protein
VCGCLVLAATIGLALPAAHAQVPAVKNDAHDAAAPAGAGALPTERVAPLPRAHSHNDYEHPHPLHDALAHGFCSVEADIHRVGEQLLVGHDAEDLQPDRTLLNLYLKPLQQRIEAYQGHVWPGQAEFVLMIDIKTDARDTFQLLQQQLIPFAELCTRVVQGQHQSGPLLVVISGNRDGEAIRRSEPRLVTVDGRMSDLSAIDPPPADLMRMVSDSWSTHFRWRGQGEFPDAERAQLRQLVQQAHAQHRLVRFWATPESTVVWQALLDADVDLINTDRLAELRAFLTDHDSTIRAAEPGDADVRDAALRGAPGETGN